MIDVSVYAANAKRKVRKTNVFDEKLRNLLLVNVGPGVGHYPKARFTEPTYGLMYAVRMAIIKESRKFTI